MERVVFYLMAVGAVGSAVWMVFASNTVHSALALVANFFALAWLAVALLNPTDLFTSGCLLSFLSVAVLYWGPRQWFGHIDDPLSQLIDEARPFWQRWLRDKGRRVAESYAVTLAIWLAIAPLAASRYHLISPVGLLLGPHHRRPRGGRVRLHSRQPPGRGALPPRWRRGPGQRRNRGPRR